MSALDEAPAISVITNPDDRSPATEAVVEEYRHDVPVARSGRPAREVFCIFDGVYGNGRQVTTHYLDGVNQFSSVAVSITEVDLNGNPFIAKAGMSINNVVPHDGGRVEVCWSIGWDSPLHARLSFIIANS